MTPGDAAVHALRAVPGEGEAARAARLAVCHVLVLDDGPRRDLWRLKLGDAEAALLDGGDAPRPGLVDIDVMRALAAAERDARKATDE